MSTAAETMASLAPKMCWPAPDNHNVDFCLAVVLPPTGCCR